MKLDTVKLRDPFELLSLAALWGASFLFMRIGAAEFGPVALAAVRVLGAALFLMPLLALRGQLDALRAAWRPIAVVGLTNSALPFVCFGFATLSITAGLASIFNAAAPLFGAVIAWLWLNERLNPSRILGLVIGLFGVLGLAWSNVNHDAGFKPGGSGWAIAACLLATLLYGFSANYTKRRLNGVAPLAVAAGSQCFAALFLLAPSIFWWPSTQPSLRAWSAVATLAIACTGVAYILFFRLIAHVGASNAITVTFLIPAFGVAWGAWFLDEVVTGPMLLGCATIVIGTALASGLLRFPLRTFLPRQR
ncbi:MAG: DMT family transporter [Burkholderiaceae bacterium]